MADVSSNNLGNLKWAWKIWRKAVGPKVKPLFEKYVDLSNEGKDIPATLSLDLRHRLKQLSLEEA